MLQLEVEIISRRSDLAFDLHKEATVFKDKGDWVGTIATLERAKVHMLTSGVSYPHDYWSRLAKFYQYAGRYEDSMREFDFLIADLERRMPLEYSVNDPSVSHGKESKRMLARKAISTHRALFKREREAVQAREARRLKKLAATSTNRNK